MVEKNQLNKKENSSYEENELHATAYMQYFILLILLKTCLALFTLTVGSIMDVYSKVELGRMYSSRRLDD